MLAYILRSLMQGLVVMVAVAFIAFSMFRFVGDPVVNMLGQEATLQDRAELTQRLGLNDPVPVQFARFIADAAQGDFGISYRQGRKVSSLIVERLPAPCLGRVPRLEVPSAEAVAAHLDLHPLKLPL